MLMSRPQGEDSSSGIHWFSLAHWFRDQRSIEWKLTWNYFTLLPPSLAILSLRPWTGAEGDLWSLDIQVLFPWNKFCQISTDKPCTLIQGYSLQLARRPPHFRSTIQSSIQDKDAHIFWSKVQTLLAKGAIETVSLVNSKSGFYSHY